MSKESLKADAELQEFLSQLDAEFGKKKSPSAKALNKKFHANNPTVPQASGKSPERMNPWDSSAWKPIHKVTHVTIQTCRNCLDAVEFIGGEYVRFRPIRSTKLQDDVLARADQCPNPFLFSSIEDPIEDVVEWHYQEVSRCSGCIKVSQQAQQTLWEEAQRKELEALQPELKPIDLTRPFEVTKKGVKYEEQIEINLGEDNVD